MKKSLQLCFLLLTLLALVLISCNQDEPDNPTDNSGKICTTDSLTFSFDKDASLIIIDTKNVWYVSSNDSWLSFSAVSGKGKTGILIGAVENTGFPRTGSLTIKAGSKTHTIKVKQAGAPTVEITVNNISFRMILVNGGTFVMGEEPNNSPAHTVQLSDFYICETEVTNELWQTVTGSLPYDNLSQYTGNIEVRASALPVTAITWNDVINTFLPAIKTKTGSNFRLPTEAEWEFAAMGGVQSKGYKFSGSNILDDVGWDSEYSGGSKQEVKLKNANELGLYDMSGNAAEWCNDWYETYYSSTYGEMSNPQGPSTGIYRVIRGGSYKSEAGILGYNECSVKQRLYAKPSGYQGSWGDTGNPDEPQIFVCDAIGFRFVLPISK